ncbi:hypothetical protein X777_10715 [Ooceraea biroi]|uniref:Uncharacterized protein n=1 Tax=Ooceraea biroi TaxID=2015173 RepID=A0A026W373_OOCBI|nr:hypothetical protein X777_10715 [Ooceraea biroi]
MKFGYLPQTGFETGNLRTEDQLRDAIKDLQVNKIYKIQGNRTFKKKLNTF